MAVLLVATVSRAQNSATIAVQAGQPGAMVSSNLFGIFFEEINFGGDGGIYAELVRNRTFGNSANPDYWTLVTNGAAAGAMAVDATQPMNAENLRSLFLTRTSGSGEIGAANSGYWGIALQAGATYDLNFYARGSNGFSGPVNVRLESADGSSVYASATFSGLTGNWQKFSTSLVAGGTSANARIVLAITNAASVWLDDVSLFPRATFNGRTNGMRPDLADKLAQLQPSFFRFPGGCFIEGNILTNAFRWKRTIGDTAARSGHWNGVWNYFSTDGLGYHEYLQLCEDLGAEPLFGINCGMSHSETVPLADMGPWVQDALDAIEYANGSTNTTWGALRAANGHPAPFHLKYMEIGNENGGASYNDRYTLFYDAIKAAHPDMKLIACVWGGTPWSRPFDLMDEHYYTSPSTMASYATKYDGYNRSGPKVFVGEYAVTSAYGNYGNLAAALGEAAFMTGIERNSDIVQLACYAPLFANVNGMQWHPNLINFDNSRCFGTPAYYVQQMFSQNRGDAVLPTAVTLASATTTNQNIGAVGLGTWSTAASYTNLVVSSNGVTLYQSDFANSGTNGWNVFNGAWSTNAGVYRQTSTGTTDCRTWTGSTNWSNYTYTLRARKDGGSEGFLIIFNWRDANNFMWWNIGGWGNTQHAIEFCQDGAKSTLASAGGSVTNGGWYDIRVELSATNIACYLNNTLIHNIPNPTSSATFHVSTTYAKTTGEVIIKAVNRFTGPVTTTINLAGVNGVATNATLIQMASGSSANENSLAAPTNVCPVTVQLTNAGANFIVTLPANSLSVFRLNTGGLNSYTNLQLQVPAAIGSGGQQVVSTVWGGLAGSWFDLTANTNHAIVWFSSNPQVASVDINGKVTGWQVGMATITATYGALELSSSQTVQVTNPAPATLVHRYSFSETSGTNVADAVAGPAWNGWLPRDGAFNGSGQLTLASSLQQYVELPAGILSNYTAVTIEAWVTFGTLPGNCFLYGFGNKNGSLGEDYIFCQPKNGRIAITDTNWTGEQGTGGGGDWSGRTIHVTSVFNPLAGYVALYTNGVLVSQNSAVTKSFNSVSNVFSYIGRSLYSGDAYFDFTMDEFRIYHGALVPADISATQVLGPDAVLSTDSPALGVSAAGGALTLAWPVASAGYVVMTTTNLAGGVWSPVAVTPQIVGSQWQVILPVSTNNQFFQLQR